MMAKSVLCILSASVLLDFRVKSEIVDKRSEVNFSRSCTSLVVSGSQSHEGKLKLI